MKTRSEVHLPSLKSGAADYVASAAKAALGAIPFAGSLLAEVAGTIIPNQRIERLVKYAEELDKRLSEMDQEFVKSQLTDENFTDMVEESIRQAARSLSDERRQYLASAMANGISSQDIEFLESKHLLRILGELNDIEVIILRFYLVPAGGDEEFWERHKDIIRPVSAYMGAPRNVLDKSALHTSYKEHLTSLGLLKHKYRVDSRTKQPEFDNMSGAQKQRGYAISPLGRLLLRQIGLSDEQGQPTEAPHDTQSSGAI